MSIDFIPINFYTPLYYHILLIFVIITFLHCFNSNWDEKDHLYFLKVIGICLFMFVLFYMGCRPIHGVFIDMKTYANIFERYSRGYITGLSNDIVFQLFMILSSKVMTVQTFFFVCAVLYVVPLYVISKKWFKEYWYFAFLLLVVSFSFWAYGVNGIRNGIAGSLFLLGISKENKWFQAIWIFLAVNVHLSILLPTAGYILSYKFNKPKVFIAFWIISIPLSLILGNFFGELIARLNIDSRLGYLIKEVDDARFSSIGFRWDFLIFSSIPVLFGCYYIFKKKYDDIVYCYLYNTYLLVNAFWILIIRSNYSNRFAYLSWFMMALVIIYPLLKKEIVSFQYKKIGLIIISYYSFTYMMNVLLK